MRLETLLALRSGLSPTLLCIGRFCALLALALVRISSEAHSMMTYVSHPSLFLELAILRIQARIFAQDLSLQRVGEVVTDRRRHEHNKNG